MYHWMCLFLKKLFVLADFSVFKIYGIFVLVWITEQTISVWVENYFWGDSFYHFFDLVFTLALATLFAVCCDILATVKEVANARGGTYRDLIDVTDAVLKKLRDGVPS